LRETRLRQIRKLEVTLSKRPRQISAKTLVKKQTCPRNPKSKKTGNPSEPGVVTEGPFPTSPGVPTVSISSLAVLTQLFASGT